MYAIHSIVVLYYYLLKVGQRYIKVVYSSIFENLFSQGVHM